jgi:hypothetical protein
MKRHCTKDFKRILKIAKKAGCGIEQRDKKTIITLPAGTPTPSEGRVYTAHDGPAAFHPVRRFLKKAGIK